jgi:hypothetical protein
LIGYMVKAVDAHDAIDLSILKRQPRRIDMHEADRKITCDLVSGFGSRCQFERDSGHIRGDNITAEVREDETGPARSRTEVEQSNPGPQLHFLKNDRHIARQLAGVAHILPGLAKNR